MTFFWANMLWLSGVLPLLILTYVILLRRKKKAAVRYASLGLVKEAMTPGRRLRRHIPPALLFLGLTALVIAVARPAAVITLPSQRAIIMLAMDVSGSMRATDVDPRRITAAQAAAKDFVNDQPMTARIGLVAFSSSAMVVQEPTQNHEELVAAIDRLQPQRFTAVGSGLLVSLKAIFPDLDFDLGSRYSSYEPRRGVPLGQAKDQEEKKPEPPPVVPGSFKSAVIVLMSDGQTNTGADPIEAARVAANRGVRVFTVGFGSEDGGNVDFEGRTVHVRLDEATLKEIADITRGTYYRAGTEAQLKEVYKTLSTQFVMETEKTEITALFAALAAAFVVTAGALSLLWFGRIV
jgi:Ca-activated chloride channel family protein